MVERALMPDWSSLELLCGTIVGEASGESEEGRRAVGCVVRNRVNSPVRWWGKGWRGVMLAPWQFSCWDDSLVRIASHKARNTTVWKECMQVAVDVFSGEAEDPTGGADHYFNPDVVTPRWSIASGKPRTPTAIIGHHKFYRLH